MNEKATPVTSEEFAILQARQRIAAHTNGSLACVVEDEADFRDGYWRVYVAPNASSQDLIAFTELLADVEGELQDDLRLPITLCPA